MKLQISTLMIHEIKRGRGNDFILYQPLIIRGFQETQEQDLFQFSPHSQARNYYTTITTSQKDKFFLQWTPTVVSMVTVY